MFFRYSYLNSKFKHIINKYSYLSIQHKDISIYNNYNLTHNSLIHIYINYYQDYNYYYNSNKNQFKLNKSYNYCYIYYITWNHNSNHLCICHNWIHHYIISNYPCMLCNYLKNLMYNQLNSLNKYLNWCKFHIIISIFDILIHSKSIHLYILCILH